MKNSEVESILKTLSHSEFYTLVCDTLHYHNTKQVKPTSQLYRVCKEVGKSNSNLTIREVIPCIHRMSLDAYAHVYSKLMR